MSCTSDGVAADADDVMLAGDGQIPAAPHEAHQHAALADEVVRAPEAQDLGLPQMVHRADVSPTLQSMVSLNHEAEPGPGTVWAGPSSQMLSMPTEFFSSSAHLEQYRQRQLLRPSVKA